MLKVPSLSLKKLMRKDVVIIKYSLSGTEDAHGQKTRTKVGEYPVKAEIQEITAEDLSYMVPGVLEVGDAFGFFLPKYISRGVEITIEVEDEVMWNSKVWRVEKIENYDYGGKEWYKRVYLKRVV